MLWDGDWGGWWGALLRWEPGAWSGTSGAFQFQAAVAVALRGIVSKIEELRRATKLKSLRLAGDPSVPPVRPVF